MKVIAINGSPRKNWNTAILLEKALEGATSKGAETELIHLYDLDYKGCRSCYSCKLKGGKSVGRCAARDDLAPVLEKALDADAIILGAPIYMGAVAGQAQSFLERLTYPLWDPENMGTFFERRIPAGFICTMGASERDMKERGFDRCVSIVEGMLGMAFGHSESIVVTDTLQFDDYSRYYYAPSVDPEAKARRRETVFPQDCEKAFEMGARFAGGTGRA